MNALKIIASIASVLLFSPFAQSANPNDDWIPGIYEIRICKDSCSPNGDDNVLVKGKLILFRNLLTDQERVRLREAGFNTRSESPRGCFVIDRLANADPPIYAGIYKRGLTDWSLADGDLRFLLFRSADAFYSVIAQRTPNGFAGEGTSWGVGAANPLERTHERVVARRIGDADIGAVRACEA